MDFVLHPLTNRENTSLCVGSEETTSPRVGNTASRVLLPSASPREKSYPAGCVSFPSVRSFFEPTHREYLFLMLLCPDFFYHLRASSLYHVFQEDRDGQ